MAWMQQAAIAWLILLSTSPAIDACLTNSDIGECEDEDAFSALQPLRAQAHLAADMIPKIVHHIYKYDISGGPWPNAIWQQSFAAWKSKFPEPEFTHLFWSDDRTNDFVKQRCPKYFSAFKKEKRDIVRADFARYCILWRLGGIYADLDYEPLQQFYEDLEPGKVNLVASPYISETYQNSLMASPPNHPYWEKLMDLALFTMFSENILLAAGPQLLDTMPMTHDVSVVHPLSCNSFQRATHVKDERERQASLRKNCKLLQPEDFHDKELKGIHWGTVSYLDHLKLRGHEPRHYASMEDLKDAPVSFEQPVAVVENPDLPAGLSSLFFNYRSASEESMLDQRPATLGQAVAKNNDKDMRTLGEPSGMA